MAKFLASTPVTTLPPSSSDDNLLSLGKFSTLVRRLSEKSMVSKASRVTARCSMAGMPRPRRTISRSPSAFGRCSASDNTSADNLMASLWRNWRGWCYLATCITTGSHSGSGRRLSSVGRKPNFEQASQRNQARRNAKNRRENGNGILVPPWQRTSLRS